MTLKVTQTFTRPDVNIPWASALPPQQVSGRIALDSSLSDDGLTQTIISLWNSQEDWDARNVSAESKTWNDQRIAYNLQNNISSSVIIETI
jgi:hypothetical protein